MSLHRYTFYNDIQKSINIWHVCVVIKNGKKTAYLFLFAAFLLNPMAESTIPFRPSRRCRYLCHTYVGTWRAEKVVWSCAKANHNQPSFVTDNWIYTYLKPFWAEPPCSTTSLLTSWTAPCSMTLTYAQNVFKAECSPIAT